MPNPDLRRFYRNVVPSPANDATLAHGGGDGHPPGMETEIALLKQRADQADQRMGRVEEKLDRIVEALADLRTNSATKEDVKRAESAAWNALAVGGGVALAVVGLIVAILTYLQDQRISTSSAPPPQPSITLNLPAWPTPPAPPPAAPAPAPH